MNSTLGLAWWLALGKGGHELKLSWMPMKSMPSGCKKLVKPGSCEPSLVNVPGSNQMLCRMCGLFI